jgi:hypothetical protein
MQKRSPRPDELEVTEILIVVAVVVGARVSRIWDCFGAALKLQSGTESRSRLCL